MQESRRYVYRGPVSHFFRTIGDMWSLVVGLWVTGYNFLRPLKTVYYPRQTVTNDQILPYRGHIELVAKPKDPFTPKCIVCMMCAKVCPSGCITVKKAKAPEGAGEDAKAPKTPGAFLLDYNLCSLCGLCVQNCPVNSLQHSHNVYLAGFSRKEFEFDLIKRLHAQAEKNKAAAPGEEKEAA